MSNNTKTVSPHWADFHRLWATVAIILFLLLLLLWLLDYGPNGSNLIVPPTIVEKIVEKQVEVDSPKLLNRIGSLEKENAGIKDLQAKIVALQNQAPIIKTVEKLVTAPDTLAPRLTIKGLSTMHMLAGEGFTDEGVIALDNIDSKVNVNVSGEVDTHKAGTYTLTYTSTDAAGNTATIKRKVTVEAPLALAKLYFEMNSSEFPAETALSLSSVISHLRTHRSSKAIISGFHDPSGYAEHNKQLAFDRSIAVRDLLQQAGITPERIELKKAEETRVTNTTEEAHRVEVSVSQ